MITYTAGAGETNSVVIDDPGSTHTFAETPITAGTGCTQTTANLVTCTETGVNSIVVNLGDMNDFVNATSEAQDVVTFNGSTGNDVIGGSGLVDTLNGGDDNDTIYGHSGNDDINGDNGNDRLDGGPGDVDDDLDGGAGIDRSVYGILSSVVTPVYSFTYTCTPNSPSISTWTTTPTTTAVPTATPTTATSGDTVESSTGSTSTTRSTGQCGANTFAGSAGTANGDVDGNDTFNGDPASCVAGDARSDFFGGGEGADDFNGDGSGVAGFDTGHLRSAVHGVGAVNVDWGGDNDDADGMGNSDDIKADIDRVIGGGSGDTINAAAAAIGVTLLGHGGDDILTGSPQADTIDGEAGRRHARLRRQHRPVPARRARARAGELRDPVLRARGLASSATGRKNPGRGKGRERRLSPAVVVDQPEYGRTGERRSLVRRSGCRRGGAGDAEVLELRGWSLARTCSDRARSSPHRVCRSSPVRPARFHVLPASDPCAKAGRRPADRRPAPSQ